MILWEIYKKISAIIVKKINHKEIKKTIKTAYQFCGNTSFFLSLMH